MRVTAVAGLFLNEGLVLTVSRKNDPNDLGLPGGKVDPEDRSPYVALARESLEETGLTIIEARMVFERVDGDFYVQTFRVWRWSGVISTREAGVVAWRKPAALLTPACKSFSEYNRALFSHIGLSV